MRKKLRRADGKKGESRIKRIFSKREVKEADAGSGVVIRISPIMLIMATVFVACGMAYEFVCSLTAVILHEFSHSVAAKKLGYALNEIKIMPYGAALCGSVDIRPKHELLIAAAGPAFNFVVALIFAAMWWLFPSSYMFTAAFCACNLYIGTFNLLPVYPMDGGRMLLAALSFKLNRKRAYIVSRIVSAAVGVGAAVAFILSAEYTVNMSFLAVGLFMIVSAFIPDSRARYYALFAFSNRRERLSKPFEKREFAVSESVPLGELCRALDPDRYTVFEVFDADMKSVRVVDETELIKLVGRFGYSAAVGDAVKDGGKGS